MIVSGCGSLPTPVSGNTRQSLYRSGRPIVTALVNMLQHLGFVSQRCSFCYASRACIATTQ